MRIFVKSMNFKVCHCHACNHISRAVIIIMMMMKQHGQGFEIFWEIFIWISMHVMHYAYSQHPMRSWKSFIYLFISQKYSYLRQTIAKLCFCLFCLIRSLGLKHFAIRQTCIFCFDGEFSADWVYLSHAITSIWVLFLLP